MKIEKTCTEVEIMYDLAFAQVLRVAGVLPEEMCVSHVLSHVVGRVFVLRAGALRVLGAVGKVTD